MRNVMVMMANCSVLMVDFQSVCTLFQHTHNLKAQALAGQSTSRQRGERLVLDIQVSLFASAFTWASEGLPWDGLQFMARLLAINAGPWKRGQPILYEMGCVRALGIMAYRNWKNGKSLRQLLSSLSCSRLGGIRCSCEGMAENLTLLSFQLCRYACYLDCRQNELLLVTIASNHLWHARLTAGEQFFSEKLYSKQQSSSLAERGMSRTRTASFLSKLILFEKRQRGTRYTFPMRTCNWTLQTASSLPRWHCDNSWQVLLSQCHPESTIASAHSACATVQSTWTPLSAEMSR